VFEKWRACGLIDPIWQRKKKALSWETDSLPASVLDQHKFTLVEALRGGWWNSYAVFEVCRAFLKGNRTTNKGVGPS